jgi:hypothetical protein
MSSEKIDYSLCYPSGSFDRQSVMWDLNYFKYNFLKLADLSFDEQGLENDFNLLADILAEVDSDCFMIRDFQSRNIMIKDEVPWFIDYQGGRRGPLHYDVASLLYSPKSSLNEIQREELLAYYIDQLQAYKTVDRTKFKAEYYNFVLVRILQALGAYGFRGLFQQKPNFRASIPTAIENLKRLKAKGHIDSRFSELNSIIDKLAKSEWAHQYKFDHNKLTIRVNSFSYKKGIPYDPSENGGGYVFDCRGLPNPGRLSEFRALSGLDKEVVDYLENHKEVRDFQDLAQKIVAISLDEYLERGFNHLCVSFGCTGGQHRSVYNAEKFVGWLQNNFGVNVVLMHNEKPNWKYNG